MGVSFVVDHNRVVVGWRVVGEFQREGGELDRLSGGQNCFMAWPWLQEALQFSFCLSFHTIVWSVCAKSGGPRFELALGRLIVATTYNRTHFEIVLGTHCWAAFQTCARTDVVYEVSEFGELLCCMQSFKKRGEKVREHKRRSEIQAEH